MAKLNQPTRSKSTPSSTATASTATASTAASTHRALRARIAELEQLLDARTQTIVGMGARLAELQGHAPPSTAQRLREAERQLAELRATKIVRYSAVPRRIYARVRRLTGV